MKHLSIPLVWLQLGRAVELDSTTWEWTWNERDNFVVCASSNGKMLAIMKQPQKLTAKQKRGVLINKSIKKAKHIFKTFNHKKSDAIYKANIADTHKYSGRANHITYESKKFGKMLKFLHKFDHKPYIWTDRPEKPSIIILLGGNISITKDGIEG